MIAFILTMPNSPTWNGRWSGENNLHCIIKENRKVPKEIVGKTFYHRWDDGWCAAIEVRHVDCRTANKMKRESCGFSGYDWMVKNIIENGEIGKYAQ